MAWTTQLYHEYYDTAGNLCRIDFKKDTAALNSLQGAGPVPIRFIRPEKELFDPIKGGGAVVTLLSSSDRLFLSAGYANVPFQTVRVEHRVAGSLVWFGWHINDGYRETYSETANYYVEMSASDGFALLDRFKFLDGSGDHYEGLKTKWEVLQIILGYWGLIDLVASIYVGLSTTSSEVTIGATETILHLTEVNCDNYYDEDGEPKTCREVLVDILADMGSFIMVSSGIIIITDINSMADLISWKIYSNAYAYTGGGTSPASSVDDIEDDIGYYITGQMLDVIPGVNRQVVRFSPYAHGALEQSIQNVEDMTFSSGTAPAFVSVGSGSSQWATNISGLLGWTFYGSTNLDKLVGARNDSTDDPEYYIRIVNPNFGATPIDTTQQNLSHSIYTWDVPHTIGTGKYYLKITGEIRADEGDDPYATAAYAIYHVGLHARIWAGAKSFDGSTIAWNTSQNEIIIMGGNYNQNNMGKWMKFLTTQSAGGSILSTSGYPLTDPEISPHDEGILIDIGEGIEGKIAINFSYMVTGWSVVPPNSGWNAPVDSQTRLIKSCDIKNIKIELIKRPELTPGNIEDIEYVGEMDATIFNDSPEIVINHGTSGVAGTPFDKGGLIYDDGSDNVFFTEFTRGGDTDTIENLLLNSVMANFEGQRIKLTANINNTTGIHSFRMTDTAYMAGKMFMITSSDLDPAAGSENITMEEVIEDSEVSSISKASRKTPKVFRNGRIYWERT